MRSHRSSNSTSKITLIFSAFCVALTIASTALTSFVNACPFCSAVSLTFTEQLKSNDVVVIAKLLEIPTPSEDPDDELPKAEFEIVDVIKGKKWIKSGIKFRTLLVGRYPIGQQFLVMGVDPPAVAWSTPMKASERLIKYLKKLEQLPESGADRLAFFQDYFEDKESVLAFDAYDEFANAPYEDLVDLKDRMDHDKLVGWIKHPETSINRRRLYFVMLGVCGGTDDIAMLEEFIKSGDRKKQAGLDSLVACYLNLKGESGVKLIEDTFIKDTEVDYVDTLAAVTALRFHGTEVEVVPKERIVAAIRLLLDRPKMADMIIPDLARWKDWSVMDRLVQMFKDADEDTNWLRVPVITYLRACPLPEAEKHIEALAKIDPDAVRRADFFLDFSDDEFGDDEEEGEDSIGEMAESATPEPDSSPATEVESATDSAKETDKKHEGSKSAPENKPEEESNGSSVEKTLTSLPVSDSEYVVRKIPLVNSESAELVAKAENQSSPSNVELTVLEKPDPGLDESESVARKSSMSNRSTPVSDREAQLAQVIPPPPAASAVEPQQGLTMMIMVIPFLASVGIFVLLWSVLNGWFERLIV